MGRGGEIEVQRPACPFGVAARVKGGAGRTCLLKGDVAQTT